MVIKKIRALLLNSGHYHSLSEVQFPAEVTGYAFQLEHELGQIDMQVHGDELMRIGARPSEGNEIPATGRYFVNIPIIAPEFEVLEVLGEISEGEYQAAVDRNSSYTA